MGLSYQPKAITLSFKEGKPVTYKAQQVTYPTIKSKDLLAYAANAANVPLANIECCVQGLIEAIAYFCINGHRVVLPEVGGFFLGVKSKSVPMAENLNVKQAVQSVHQFEDYPEPRRGGCGTLSPMPFAYVAPSTR